MGSTARTQHLSTISLFFVYRVACYSSNPLKPHIFFRNRLIFIRLILILKMKSIQFKGKNKKKGEKVKLSTRNMNSTISPDLSSLRKPVDTSASDLYQVSKLLENGTEEVKSILSYECDIIYECRTCHSLFRSIINLISHKREYCREKFNITHKSVLNNYNLYPAKESIIHMYETEQTIIKDSVKSDRILRSQVSKEERKKDLSAVIDRLKKKKEDALNNSSNELKMESSISNIPNNQHIYLESLDTNCSAIYQTVKSSDTMDNSDLMKEQIEELQNMANQHTITLDGQILENQLEKSDSPIQVDMGDEESELAYRLPTNNLACTICNAKFSTKKTLTFHIKTLHTSQRICYSCPCCSSTFTNTWSVYRHLYKVHKKTNREVRKLRSLIQAFHRGTTAMEGLQNACATKASALDNVTTKNSDKTHCQDSIDHIKSNVELKSCNRRKKRMGKKTALPTHLQYCQPSTAACDEIRIRIEQSDKTLSDSTFNNILCETEDTNAITDMIIQLPDEKNVSDIISERTASPEIDVSIHVKDVSTLSKEEWDKLENPKNYPSECNSVDDKNEFEIITSPMIQDIGNSESLFLNENQGHFESNNLELPEIVYANTNGTSSVTLKMKNKKRKLSSYYDEKQLADLKKKDTTKTQENSSRLQLLCSIRPIEKGQISPMESKIATIANFRKLQCLLCKRKFTSIPNLRRHMAMHIGWNRYRCKLCDFKSFTKCDCVTHCNKVHNAQNNRANIAEIIIEIPQNEYTDNDGIIMNVTNMSEKMDELDIMDVITSPKIHVDLDNSSDSKTCITLSNEAATTNEEIVEPRGDAKHQDIDAENSNKTATMENLTNYMMNCGSGKLDAHPDLKRMVMEVILGPSDTGATKQTDSDKSVLESSDDAREPMDTTDNEINTVFVDKSREEDPCTISDSLKHQRPMRNRMKPLNNDFIYDLKEVAFRKECAFFDDTGTLHMRKKAKWYK